MYLEHEIERTYPGFGNPRALAIDFLRAHERFHYQADVQTLLFETVLGRQMYEPVRWAFKGRASHFVEEALANRQAWDWARKADIEEFAFDFMKLQPNAYARFDEDRVELASEWAGVVVDRLHPSKASRNDLAHWVESPPKIYLRRSLCPEYVVFPTDLSKWISTALKLPPVKQIQEAVPVLRLLTGRFANLKAAWEETKRKLLVEALARGLNFKPWPKAGRDCCSVRVDQNFRAHLRHLGAGVWEVFEIGPHTKLGHG
jgi:hypothetical protein